MTRLDDELARRFIPRQVWGARRARSVTRFTPDFGDSVHYSEVPAASDHARCASQVRGIQSYHMDAKRWVDVAYSDLPCQHGFIFEGRGPLVRTAANGTDEGNDSAHASCALLAAGEVPTEELLNALAVSAARVNRAAGLSGINGHRDWKATGCPGDPLYLYLPTIRQRANELLVEPAPPVSVPPITSGPGSMEAALRLLVNVPIRDHRGYVDLRKGVGGLPATIGADRVLALTFAGDNPSDGWGPKALAPAELVNAAGVARIVVTAHEVNDGAIGVYVTVAD